MILKEDRVLTKLSIQKDGSEYTIGSKRKGVFIRVPEAAAIITQMLDGILTIEEIQMQIKENRGLDLDVMDYIEALLSMELIYSINGDVKNEALKPEKYRESNFIDDVANWLFGKVMLVVYLVLALASMILIIIKPDMYPAAENVFVVDYVGVNALIFCVLSIILTFIHEFAHYLAAKKEQIDVKFNISMRLYWVVIEANMNGIWSIRKNSRYVVYLAGMAWDFTLLFISFLLQIIFSGLLLERIGKVVVLIIVFRILWQFLVFMRTDLYYVLLNATHTSSLNRNIILCLVNIFAVANKQQVLNWQDMCRQDKNISKIGSIVYLIGFLIATYLFVFISLPAIYLVIKQSVNQIMSNSFMSYGLFDALFVLMIIFAEMCLWIVGLENRFHLKFRALNKLRRILA